MIAGRVPTPDFDPKRYQRPNRDWICGNACDGCPCRLGPTPSGECRTTAECSPLCQTREDGTKSYKCTRPKEFGGPCESGPKPDGGCGRPVIKCKPVRSFRARRGLVTRAVIAVSVAVLLLGFSAEMREAFLNPAPISVHHSGPDFERLIAKKGASGQGCVACHVETTESLPNVARSAFAAALSSLTFENLMGSHPRDFSRVDASCMKCHPAHDFHEANVIGIVTCSNCHLEHQGSMALSRVPERQCINCHGDEPLMKAFALQSRRMRPELFKHKSTPGLNIHAHERPPEGLTTPIRGFAKDHPEFHTALNNMRDTNTLKFNHKLHLTGDTIPMLRGKKLDCTDCHQPDPAGAFMQRVTFEQNCRACHSLSFDENTPGLQLPHGDAVLARSFLRSLSSHYADYAARKAGISGKSEIAQYVEEQMRSLRARVNSGEDLERAVFFADGQTGETTVVAGMKREARSKFAGCAYCHEVTPRGDLVPLITKPEAADRWFTHSQFNHGRHRGVECRTCHAATESERTADIILPGIKRCIECHSPKGGVAHACSTCHVYHRERPAGMPPLPVMTQ
jgi:hypothetical protein